MTFVTNLLLENEKESFSKNKPEKLYKVLCLFAIICYINDNFIKE